LICNNVASFDGGIQFLYTIKMFQWDVEIFTEYQTATLILNGIAFFLVLSFFSYINLRDTTIGVMAVISAITSLVIMSLTSNGGIL